VNTDSHQFIDIAIKNGAKAIIAEKRITQISTQIPNDILYIRVQDSRETWAKLEAQKFGNPEKKLKIIGIIGITGTDGKTTTGAFYNSKEVDVGAHTTTPTPNILFRILKDMVDKEIEYVVLEITSHGLIHKRVHGIQLIVAGITNITEEHLDAHGSYEKLIKAKAMILNMASISVLNPKSPGYNELTQYINPGVNAITVDLKKFDINRLTSEFRKNFPGDYNIENARLATEICRQIGVPDSLIYEGLNTTIPPKGRFSPNIK